MRHPVVVPFTQQSPVYAVLDRLERIVSPGSIEPDVIRIDKMEGMG